MDLVNNLTFHFHAAPIRVGPFELRRVDHARGSVRPVRLVSRCRIGMKMVGLVYPETVERTPANGCDSRKITAIIAFKLMERAPGILFGAFFQNKVDRLGFWRPNPKMSLVAVKHLSADGITTFQFHFCISRFDVVSVRFTSGCGGVLLKRNTRAALKST